jgi:hypothetical protein
LIFVKVFHDRAGFHERDEMIRANTDALWIAITEITLGGLFLFDIIVDTAIRAGQVTESATQAFRLRNPYDAIC